MKLSLKIFTSSILLLFALFAQSNVIISPENSDIFIKSFLQFEDESNALPFELISSKVYNNKFVEVQKSTFNYGFSKSSHWFRLDVENTSSEAKSIYVEVDFPSIKECDFYEVGNGILLNKIKTGADRKFDSRNINSLSYYYKIHLNSFESKSLYISLRNYGGYMKFPIYVKIPDSFYTNYKDYSNGIFYGILVFIIIINAFYFLANKDKVYLNFIFYIGVVLLFIFNNTGLLFKFIWHDSPQISNSAYTILSMFIALGFLWYSNRYFQVRTIAKKMNDIYRGISIIIIALFALNYVFNVSSLVQFYVLIFVSTIVLTINIIASYDRYYSDYKPSSYYRFSLLFLLFGIVIYLYGPQFGINEFFANEIALKIAIILHFLTLSFGLSERYRMIKVETDKINEDLEVLERERIAEIINQKEQLVSQREELLSQKEELEVQQEQLIEYNVELEKLSLVAKNTHNIIYIFDKKGYLEWFNKLFSSLLGLDAYKTKPGAINIKDLSLNNKIDDYLQQCIKTKKPIIYESLIANQENEKKWYQTTLSPILDENGEIEKLIAIDADVTELKKYELRINEQRKNVELQKKEITDSIRYAKRIQYGILPYKEALKKYLSDSFVILLPKDIVSGDFYWYQKIDNKHVIITVDCTGHGVPGAFMSIIGTYLLNNIILHNKVYDPAEILKQLNRKIKISLKPDHLESSTSDGMDVAIVMYNEQTSILEFSGALRPLYLFQNGNLVVIKGDNNPISSDIRSTSLNKYHKHTIKINPSDCIYMFSDGILDQFGGEHGKKYLSKRFKELLHSVNHLPMVEQDKVISDAFFEWKNGYDQIDDMILLGIRF